MRKSLLADAIQTTLIAADAEQVFKGRWRYALGTKLSSGKFNSAQEAMFAGTEKHGENPQLSVLLELSLLRGGADV